MQSNGFSISEIARALRISETSIRTVLGDEKNVESRNNKINKGSRNNDNEDMQRGRRAGYPIDPIIEERGERSEDIHQNKNASGEIISGEQITFTGGKSMKKEDSDEDGGYECPDCGAEFDSHDGKCPKCGAEFEEEDEND